MNRQQAFLFGLGSEIHDICMKHGITYFLGCGTLLGVIRHGGIIPWDDDFDVLMPYDQWLKFKEVCQNPANLPPNRMLCAPDLQESYGQVMPRYVALDTTCIHKNQSLHQDYAGYVIDIFILDPVRNDPDEIREYAKDVSLYHDMVSYAGAVSARAGASYEEYQETVALADRLGKIGAAKEFEKRLTSHFDPDGDIFIHRWQGSGTIYRRSDFAQAIRTTIGAHEYLIPRGYNGVLRSSFNDEWPQMPKNASAAKHSAPESLDIPYDEALEFYRPTQNLDSLRQRMLGRRRPILESAPDAHRLTDMRIRSQAASVLKDVERRLVGHEDEFRRALELRDGKTLNRLLGRYPSWQVSGPVIGRRYAKLFWRTLNPILADASDDVFEALILALMCTGRIGRAHQVLRVSQQVGRPLSQAARGFFDDLELFRSATDDVCYGRNDDALEKAHELRSRYEGVVEFWQLEVECSYRLYQENPSEQALVVLEGLLSRALSVFEGEGFFLKYQADCKEARGEDAVNDYLVAAESTTNGLILTEIQKRFGYAPSWLRNKPWAKKNGVPQWGGKTPKSARSGAKTTFDSPESVLDENQRSLLSLASRITGLCAQNGLRCCCGPVLSQALFVKRALPDRIDDYALVLPAKDLTGLLPLVNKEKGLRISYCESEGSEKSLHVKIYDTESCLLRLTKPLEGQESELYVTLYVLESDQEPVVLRRLMNAWKRGSKSGAFEPAGMRAQLAARVWGMRGRTATTAKSLIDKLSGVPDAKESYLLKTEHGEKKIASTLFDACGLCSFAGFELSVPADLKTYTSGEDASCSRSLDTEKRRVVTPYFSYGQLLEEGVIDSQWEEIRLRYEKKREELDGEAYSSFSLNYSQLKLAVRLKELSRVLLPQKEHIKELADAGKTKELSAILKDYRKCYEKYHEVGTVFLDDDIDEALRLIVD